MARRAATTLILVTRDDVTRADFGRGAAPLGQWRRPRPEAPDLVIAVEAALLSAAPGRVVGVLAAELGALTLALPAAKVAGLDGDELAQALAFETESLSGHSPFDAAVGHAPAPAGPGEVGFWVV